MRILGCVLILLLLAGCSTSSEVAPTAQETVGREALRAAQPGITAALAPTSHSFGGLHLHCRWGRNDYEYSISGGVISPGRTWRSGLDALADELAGSGWTLTTAVDGHGVKAERDDVTLFVSRQQRTEDGVEWAVQITTPCVTYAEEDADAIRLEGGLDDLSDDF